MTRYRFRVYPEDTLERTAEELDMEKCGEGRVMPDGGLWLENLLVRWCR